MLKQLKKSLLAALTVCMGFGCSYLSTPVQAISSLSNETILSAGKTDNDDAVTSLEEFIECLKELEVYAEEYAGSHAGEDKQELVINYVRTGVERYRDGSWAILAGEQNDEFVQYVTVQDSENGTDTSDIRNLKDFKLPNDQTVDFGHMFGTMNVTSYMAVQNPTAALIYADLGGWAGDLADLMEGTVEEITYSDDLEDMVKQMSEKYLGVEKTDTSDYGFGQIDIYGDLDAYYIMQSLTGSKTISTVIENYFNKNLTDKQRATFFVYNRFGEVASREAMRNAIYDAYSNNTMIIETLEPSKGLNDKTNPKVKDLRYAVCYAFADYLWNLTGVVTDYNENNYYSVFDSEKSTLAPGVTQEKKLATTADDSQIVYYIATADVTRSDLTVAANYKDNDGSNWGMARVMDQMNAAIQNHSKDGKNYIENYNPVVGVNGDFYDMVTGKVAGALVMEGTVYNTASGKNFFAILKDGTPILGSGSDWNKYADQIQESIGGGQWIVQNGKNVGYAGANYTKDRASRTAVGITADNKVVVMVLDGRQGTYSAGGAMVEIAQIMLEAGCVNAINLDGGGSTTYIAKEEGSDSLAVINSPSDGYERSVSSSLMIVSTAKPSDEFSHAIVTADSDYLTVGTSVNLQAMGVSQSGGSAELPEGTILQLSNDTIGTLKDGVFTATATGKTDVQVVVDGKVVGKKTFNVVVPTSIVFEKDNINAIYGESVELPIKATYNGNKVKINSNDVVLALDKPDAGTLDGIKFTGTESSKVRTVRISAILTELLDENTDAEGNITYQDYIDIDLYKKGEASFDFENATAGSRKFAYVRDIANTTTKDDKTYFVVDLDKDVVGTYSFGLDMKEIPIPEVLNSLVGMLPGGDVEGVRAWDFLLQLAERINPLTEVSITFQVDPNFELDISELTLVNELFRLTSKHYDDETNTLTINFNWIDQEAALDPAQVNSICILSGLKVIPKDGTDDVLNAHFTGQVDYDIYLRANAVYSMFQDEEKVKEFGIYPYIDPTNENDKGGHFLDTLAVFDDSFTLNKTGKEGWYTESDGNLYYYVDNSVVTGIQKLPTYLSEGSESYYEFDDKGACKNSKGITGLFEYENNLYYTIAGIPKSGWRTIVDGENKYYYYFDQTTGAAVNGTQKIDGYTYTFTDFILTKGEVVKDSKGSRYIWAGEFSTQEWVTIDGKRAYTAQNGYFYTGLKQAYNTAGQWVWILFDDEGYVVDHTGVYTYNDNIYLLDNGFVVEYAGLVYIDGYYYYFTSSNVAVKNRSYYVTKNNGLLPQKQYQFDEYGRMLVDGKPNPKPDDDVKGDIDRVYGEDRYSTSYNVADLLKENLNVDKFDTIIITTGENFADALAGSALAAKYNAPILSTVDWKLDELVNYVKENVKENGKVYILGGINAVPATLDNKLQGYNIERLAGDTRYDTNLAILKEAGVNSKELLICTGNAYADALSASATGLPILLVGSDGLTNAQKEFLANGNADTFHIIGGVNAVSTAVENELKAYGSTNRIGGATRYETSVMIAKEFFEKPETAIVAYAENFPDALSGGPLAMSLNAPLVLSNTGQEAAASQYMKENNITEGIVLGGSKLISDAAAIKIFNVSENTTITSK